MRTVFGYGLRFTLYGVCFSSLLLLFLCLLCWVRGCHFVWQKGCHRQKNSLGSPDEGQPQRRLRSWREKVKEKGAGWEGVGEGVALYDSQRANCRCKSQMWKIYFIFLAFKLNKVFVAVVLFALAFCHLRPESCSGFPLTYRLAPSRSDSLSFHLSLPLSLCLASLLYMCVYCLGFYDSNGSWVAVGGVGWEQWVGLRGVGGWGVSRWHHHKSHSSRTSLKYGARFVSVSGKAEK